MVEIKVEGAFNSSLEQKFNKDIAAVEANDVLIISITSNGGEVEVLKNMAVTIFELKKKKVEVLTYVPEFAASAGFFLFLLGDHREMEPSAKVHYHPPRIQLESDTVVTKNDLSEMLTDISAYQDFTNGIFRASCNIEDDLFSLLENSELPMNRQHLISLGIIDNN